MNLQISEPIETPPKSERDVFLEALDDFGFRASMTGSAVRGGVRPILSYFDNERIARELVVALYDRMAK